MANARPDTSKHLSSRRNSFSSFDENFTKTNSESKDNTPNVEMMKMRRRGSLPLLPSASKQTNLNDSLSRLIDFLEDKDFDWSQICHDVTDTILTTDKFCYNITEIINKIIAHLSENPYRETKKERTKNHEPSDEKNNKELTIWLTNLLSLLQSIKFLKVSFNMDVYLITPKNLLASFLATLKSTLNPLSDTINIAEEGDEKECDIQKNDKDTFYELLDHIYSYCFKLYTGKNDDIGNMLIFFADIRPLLHSLAPIAYALTKNINDYDNAFIQIINDYHTLRNSYTQLTKLIAEKNIQKISSYASIVMLNNTLKAINISGDLDLLQLPPLELLQCYQCIKIAQLVEKLFPVAVNLTDQLTIKEAAFLDNSFQQAAWKSMSMRAYRSIDDAELRTAIYQDNPHWLSRLGTLPSPPPPAHGVNGLLGLASISIFCCQLPLDDKEWIVDLKEELQSKQGIADIYSKFNYGMNSRKQESQVAVPHYGRAAL